MATPHLSKKNRIWLRHRFGEEFASLVLLSPTLIRDVEELRQVKVRVHTVKGCDVAWSEEGGIYLSCDGNAVCRSLALAHEKYHHVNQGAKANPNPLRFSKRGYLQRIATIEAQATDHHLRALHEMITADKQVRRRIRRLSLFGEYYFWLNGGQSAIRKVLLDEATVPTGETYRQYYTRIWRAVRGLRVKKPPANIFIERYGN